MAHELVEILLVQFRTTPSAIDAEVCSFTRAVSANDTCVRAVSALNADLDWMHPETILQQSRGVILGGSGDLDFDGGRTLDDPVRTMSHAVLDRLRPFFTHLIEYDIPTLGICFGHQILGAFAGATVHHDPLQSKVGTHKATVLLESHDSFLFSDIPRTVQVQYGHKDVLDRVPDGATLIMEGERCRVAGLRYSENIHTLQFHPELSYDDMIDRFTKNPGYVPAGAVIQELVSDTPHAPILLRNFAQLVERHAQKG
jgi:GMP synthase-like glutamine amidotransferase